MTLEILYYLLTMFKVADSAWYADQIICDQQSFCQRVLQVLMDIIFITNRRQTKMDILIIFR